MGEGGEPLTCPYRFHPFPPFAGKRLPAFPRRSTRLRHRVGMTPACKELSAEFLMALASLSLFLSFHPPSSAPPPTYPPSTSHPPPPPPPYPHHRPALLDRDRTESALLPFISADPNLGSQQDRSSSSALTIPRRLAPGQISADKSVSSLATPDTQLEQH